MLCAYTPVSCRFQTLVQWHVIFVYCCILQVSDPVTMVCNFGILFYPSGFRPCYCGMLFWYTVVSFRFQTLLLWYAILIYCYILQVSDPGTVICYFDILLYPSGFRPRYCGIFFWYTIVSFRFQTLLLWHVILIYCCILQVSDPGTVICYFGILLCPSGFRPCYCGVLFWYTVVSFRFQTLVLWYVIFIYCCIFRFQTLLQWYVILIYCCILQVSDPGTVYVILIYCCIFTFQTLLVWYVILIYCSILQISDTCPAVHYFRTLLYLSGISFLFHDISLSNSTLSSKCPISDQQ